MKTEQQSLKSNTRNTFHTKHIVLTGMFTALICVMAQLTIPTQPIPFTLSLFAIFLTGALLPPRYALMSVLAYILLGAFGLPVFANMRGGLQVLTGNTGGYIMAYPLMAFVIALLVKYIKKLRVLVLAAGMLIALTLCYLFGSLWFAFMTSTSLSYALTVCVYPFIFFDIIKAALAISVSVIIRKAIKESNYLS